MNVAPFWPFVDEPALLEFKPRGEVLRLSNPDYDGIFDDIDLEFDVQLAMAGQEYEAEISQNGDQWRAEVYFRNGARRHMSDQPTKEEAIAWCGKELPKLKEEVDRALKLSAKFEPGMYLLQDYISHIWIVVSLTHEDGFAQLWHFGWEVPENIDEVWHDTLTPLTITAPDGSIVGE
jgi:hypothetical protein